MKVETDRRRARPITPSLSMLPVPDSGEIEREAKRAHLLRVRSEALVVSF
ncbi:hypothetical protein H7849_23520 [Alloacidobacterium dinghuense]|uniref:Uncharacterized protein n=1 Tax=Alloacidobacterium dinghuense TaxID=2763107 RepID=A0A7G8BHD1_9BACT|nr:hypothetical protein [Alloacidobacterium dinghuense]QNI31951.1 hypothetical protein H7849_23520 [Alloacidobacterium dinghuense]